MLLGFGVRVGSGIVARALRDGEWELRLQDRCADGRAGQFPGRIVAFNLNLFDFRCFSFCFFFKLLIYGVDEK